MTTVWLNSFVLRQLPTPFDDDLPEAKNCTVILYSHEVLARDDDAESDLPWEIISVNANQRKTPGCEPMPVETLLYNHFHQDGGTATEYTLSQFENKIKESFLYWKDRAMIDGRKSYWKISNAELVARVEKALASNNWGPGYIDGVIEVYIPVSPGEFFCPIVELVEGDKLIGEYRSRRSGEIPRKNIGVQRSFL